MGLADEEPVSGRPVSASLPAGAAKGISRQTGAAAMAPLVAVPLRSEAEIHQLLQEGGRTVIALSGGVDSAVMAHLAFDALGARAHAVTFTGPSTGRAEVERSQRVARAIGIAQTLLPVDPLALPAYRENPSNRCYFCRTTEFGALRAWGDPRGFDRYVDGVHADDLGEERPGLKALEEARVLHPLAWAGWGKAKVRSYARRAELPNWDEPSEACLASRVTHGRMISEPLLRRIERAEEELRARGFRRVRVRTDGAGARVEVDPADVPRLTSSPLCEEIVAALREHGFVPVVLDPSGYRPRPGS